MDSAMLGIVNITVKLSEAYKQNLNKHYEKIKQKRKYYKK